MSSIGVNELRQVNIDTLLATLPADIRVTLEHAESLCHDLPEERTEPLPCMRVKKLGRLSEEEKKDGRIGVADMVATGQKTFCVGFRGCKEGSASYFLGIQDDTQGNGTQSLLQASFAISEVESLDERKYRYQNWGACKRVNANEELFTTQLKSTDIPVNWIDMLAKTLFNHDCEAALIFTPLNPEWLKTEMQKVTDTLDVLSKYQESSLQISVSGGTSVILNGHVGERLKEFFVANRKENNNENVSTSVNLKQEHWVVNTACENLKLRLQEIEQLRRDGGWMLSIRVSAQRESDLNIIKQIVGGVFVQIGYQCSWRVITKKSAMVLPGSHLRRLVHYPNEGFPGLELESVHKFEANPPKCEGPVLESGKLVWNGRVIDDIINIPLKDLNCHAFICGKSGYGKTNSVCSLLSGLKDIPFLVIEPVKGEYRSLKSIMPDLQVFNLEIHGKNQLHMNPFWFPAKGRLNYHIDCLKSIIAASFELTAAMPDILEQCLVSSYIKKGWNISTNQNIFAGKLPEDMLYPTFTTLCNEVELYLEKAAFAPELKSNYKGALLSRLQSFTTGTKGLLLNCPSHSPFEDWIRNKTRSVIELDELADDSDKAIVMGTLLSQYFQCIKYGSSHIKPELRHIIVLEEAHHLFKDVGASDSKNSTRQHLVEMLTNLLAEIRAYGEGIFIVDQSPTSVSSQVIKNTAVKLVHHCDYVEDLKILRDSLLLEEEDENAPATLKRGYALLRYGAMTRPVHVSMPLCECKEEMGIHRETLNAADDAQNILDMIRMNQVSRERLRKKCRMFLNHLLFDTPRKKFEALHILREAVLSEAVVFGYDRESLEALSMDGLEYIMRTMIIESLSEMYPNQYLLCGRLQMVVERYTSLCLLQTDSITEHQSLLLEQYIHSQIHPSLAYYYQNSVNPKIRRIAELFQRQTGIACMSEIILHMQEELNKVVVESKKAGKIYNYDVLFANPAELVVQYLCSGDFLHIPNLELAKNLWQMFQQYWKDTMDQE